MLILLSVITVDGAIHNAAGWSLRDECQELNGCKPGNSKLTSGHRLPAKCKNNINSQTNKVLKLEAFQRCSINITQCGVDYLNKIKHYVTHTSLKAHVSCSKRL